MNGSCQSPARRFVFLAVLLLMAAGPTVSVAQPAPAAATVPATQPAPATRPAPASPRATTQPVASTQPAVATQPAATTPRYLTAATIQARKEQVLATAMDEALRRQILDYYDKALASVQQAENWQKRAADSDRLREAAPAELEAMRKRLAEPASQPVAPLPAAATTSQIEQVMASAQAELAAAKKEADDLDSRPKFMTDRRAAMPRLIAEARERLDAVETELAAPTDLQVPSALASAKRTALMAARNAASREIESLEKDIPSFEVRTDLAIAQRDLAVRRAAQAEKKVKLLQDLLNDRRKQEALAEAEKAAAARQAAVHPILKALAQENEEIALRRTGENSVGRRIEETSLHLDSVNESITRLRGEFRSIQERVRAAGLNNAVALLLRKQREDLPDVRSLQRRLQAIQGTISDVQLELISLEERRRSLSDLDARVQEVLAPLDPGDPARRELEKPVRDLLKARRGYLDSLINDHNVCWRELVDLDSAKRRLIDEVSHYAQYVDERLLWIRSAPVIGPADAARAADSVQWLLGHKQWQEVLQVLWQEFQAAPVLVVLGLLGLGFLMGMSRLAWRRVGRLGQAVSRTGADAVRPTLESFALTLYLSAVWPTVLWFFAWMLSGYGAGEFARAVSDALDQAGVVLFTLNILIQVCRDSGLADAHFQWSPRRRKAVRVWLGRLAYVAVPLAFLVALTEGQSSELRKESLGRLSYILLMAAAAVAAQRLLRPDGPVLQAAMGQRGRSWINRFRHVWYALGVGLPILLALGAAAGYYYTALQLSVRLTQTAWLVLGLLLVNAVLLRWLSVARRLLAVRTARSRLEAKQARGDQAEAAVEAPTVVPQAMDLSAADAQTQELLKYVVAIALLIGLGLIWMDVLPALTVLKRVELWNGSSVPAAAAPGVTDLTRGPATQPAAAAPAGHTRPVTLADLILAVLLFVLTFVAAKNIPGMLEVMLLQRLRLEPGGRYTASVISRYIIFVVGIVVGFSLLGVSWDSVQWLVAAVTVGLGFGLQEIFANFVSGLIILFERPMRVGDTVTVGDITGTVLRIRTRATTIIDFDRKEVVVPNKEFITSKLVNWTLSDTILRVTIPLGVDYGTDTKKVHDLLMEVAKANPKVLKDPPPVVLFMDFGESDLRFELRLFVPDMNAFVRVRHEVNLAIDEAFRKAGIEMPFPQRDLRIRSVDKPIPVKIVREDQDPPGK